jgi:hypothetical protein
LVERRGNLCKKERLIEGDVSFIDRFGVIYVNGRALQPIVKKGDYIVIYRPQEKNSHGIDKK